MAGPDFRLGLLPFRRMKMLDKESMARIRPDEKVEAPFMDRMRASKKKLSSRGKKKHHRKSGRR
jgi:hypothetical protein